MSKKALAFSKNLFKWGVVVLCSLVTVLAVCIYCRLRYFENSLDFLFHFGGYTIFDIEVFLYVFTSCFLGCACYFQFTKKMSRRVFLLAFILVFILGCFWISMKGFLTDYYTYYTFLSPRGSNELVMVDKSYLHDSNYSLYVRQNKYLLREIDNAPLYELTPNFHWDERTYSLTWIDETIIEIQAVKSNERIRFSLE